MSLSKRNVRRIATGGVRTLALACAAALLGSSAAAAQGGQGNNARAELRKVTQQIRQVRKNALQDSSLQQRQMQLQEMIQKAMIEADPGTEKRQKEMTDLRGEIRKAQQNGEKKKLRSLFSKFQKLQQQNRKVQRKVMQGGEIAKELKKFREQLRQKMTEINPQTRKLLARQDSLLGVVQARQQGGGMGGGSGSGGG